MLLLQLLLSVDYSGFFAFILTNSKLFPIFCVPVWQPANALIIPDSVLKNWLLDTSSLTERLQSCSRQFSVKVLGQGIAPTQSAERQLIDLQDDQPIVREVLLQGNQQPWVYARTLMPKALCEDGVNRLADLGDKPLGKVIFNDSRFVRQPFEICCFQGASALHQALSLPHEQVLWGRRSVFTYQQYKMTVAEIFLPGAPSYKNMSIRVK
ncbi:chorismate lyase [Alteromonadaceae bacterium BrNp21-10]|nr:chorismate lyase [Alteromonadaceae bacterium BrNp21-10]